MKNIKLFDFKAGMKDETLEFLADAKERRFLGFAPWVCWESENSSFGKCFRRWAFYPSFLPLFIISPHGAYSGSTIRPNEVDNRARVFFGWPKKRVKRRISEFGMSQSYCVKHPWVNYRKKTIGDPQKDRKGILYFFPHSNNNHEPKFSSLEKTISMINKVGEEHGGVTICLSFHDIRKGLHKKLRKYNIPIVTAGCTNSHLFIDRFYRMIYSFKYTCSSIIGSQTYYSIEAGIPHFLLGEKVKYIGTGIGRPKGMVAKKEDYGDSEDLTEIANFESSLQYPNLKISSKQSEFVDVALGKKSTINRFQASLIIWRELVLNFPRFIKMYINLGARKLRVNGKK